MGAVSDERRGDQIGITFAEADTFYVTTVRLTTGGASGGAAQVAVTADLLAYTNITAACPCEVVFTIYDLANDTFSQTMAFTIGSEAPPSGYRMGTGSTSWVFAAQSGTTKRYGLAVDVTTTGPTTGGSDGGDDPVAALFGAMTASYVPFGPSGSSVLQAPSRSAPPFASEGQLDGRVVKPESP